jgi:hypothetical protein
MTGILIAAVHLVAMTSATSLLDTLSVPPGALNKTIAATESLPPVLKFQYHAAPVDSDAVSSFYDGVFAKKGWRRCEPSGEKWKSVVDANRSPTVLVHSRVLAWIEPSAERVVFLTVEYTEPYPSNGSAPQNGLQSIRVFPLDGAADVRRYTEPMSCSPPAAVSGATEGHQ